MWVYRRLQWGLVCIALIGCQQTPPKKDTIRICNSDGCSERPSDHASYDPASVIPDEDPDGRIAALEELAREDPRAAYDLGLRFFRGDGVKQDSYRALQWMRDAAERGDLDAQKALGRLYLTGLEEMGPDPGEAQKWLRIAVSRGDTESEALLMEATRARQNEGAYFRWRTSWRPTVYQYWYTGYPYKSYWRGGRWHYRYR